MKSEPCHMMVFRDVRQQLPGKQLHSELLAELNSIQINRQNEDAENLLVSALLRSGELECALTDLAAADDHHHHSAKLFADITDVIARSLLSPEHALQKIQYATLLLQQVKCPERVSISPPEGFCFYALHPFDYVHSLDRLALDPSQPVMVVGIRSMGTTLSAMVLAGLREKLGNDFKANRITVRPTGHPYDRRTSIVDHEHELILEFNRLSANFLIVDEGPGLSGSSFLSAGDALHALGVPKGRIQFICSRPADPDQLVATDASSRWRSYTSHVVSPTRDKPTLDSFPICGGTWRNRTFTRPEYLGTHYDDPAHWPAVWPQLSPSKFLSEDESIFFKYEGLGRYGSAVRERSRLIAEAGFSVEPAIARNGFTSYRMAEGTPLSALDISSEVLQSMASYLAFRLKTFEVNEVNCEVLEEMTRFNHQNIFGRELGPEFRMKVEHPVIADARMMPYEWMKAESNRRLLKLDCSAHGDNHFLPGPVDIAWDVAGAIIEWEMDTATSHMFVDLYERASGDRVRARLHDYLVAYSAFQAGYSMMAASAVGDDFEERQRLLRDHGRYREILQGLTAAQSTEEIQITSRTGLLRIPQSPVLQT
ncbi:MAG: hypothetical protein JWO13_2678 [Acidobacteriales bacterium]|nr:hypothetical protein [Terriglobales bacterium]